MLAMDNNDAIMLVLLDLPAAFDTIDHAVLLQRVHDEFGIHGTAVLAPVIPSGTKSVCEDSTYIITSYRTAFWGTPGVVFRPCALHALHCTNWSNRPSAWSGAHVLC